MCVRLDNYANNELLRKQTCNPSDGKYPDDRWQTELP